jgi:hypothetical protein
VTFLIPPRTLAPSRPTQPPSPGNAQVSEAVPCEETTESIKTRTLTVVILRSDVVQLARPTIAPSSADLVGPGRDGRQVALGRGRVNSKDVAQHGKYCGM